MVNLQGLKWVSQASENLTKICDDYKKGITTQPEYEIAKNREFFYMDNGRYPKDEAEYQAYLDQEKRKRQ